MTASTPPGAGEPGEGDQRDPIPGSSSEGEPPQVHREPSSPRRRPPRPWMKSGAVALAVAALVGAALAYRSHHRGRVLAQGMARAQQLMRPDTWSGYRDAARLLEPLAQLDELEAGSLRAFALAALFADYRDDAAGREAEALLVKPGRAAVVPDWANLATAALALGRREAGTATTFAGRAGASAWAQTLQARTALLAGSLPAARESAGKAIAADPDFPRALAIQGDVLRREKRFAEARQAYRAALAVSPRHPRATYGVAKLALASQIPASEAMPPLRDLLGDQERSPPAERARAALHLAALQMRGGDRAGASATLDRAGVDAGARAWLERAAAAEALERTTYRVVDGAPRALQSALDDDPYEPPPATPSVEPAKPAPKAAVAPTPKRKISKKAAAKTSKSKPKTKKKASAKGASKTGKATPRKQPQP